MHPAGGRNEIYCLQANKLDRFINKSGQLRFRNRADFGCFNNAAFKNHQCRNSANAVTGRCLRVFINIQFCNFQFALILDGDFFKNRCESFYMGHTTRPSNQQSLGLKIAKPRPENCHQ